ncbi:hypothetical protein L249_3008 [Ophiocordyceps polyrhachis-furcata BCC 54312]|uniref:Uncharacterized protein n=1 Tax=Ophiocordyceps polyrhachis-furcata BCC 54312 TaxID=1330021 RepID=A0A367LN97_9HYPO|nr:hypothetical protein L249_3008 [Ophiocordyceps polyrhachis-furcata BCC 54312]
MAGQGGEIVESSGSAGRRSSSLSPSMESQMLQLYNAVHNPQVPAVQDAAFASQQQLGFQMSGGSPRAGPVGDDIVDSSAGSAGYADNSGFVHEQGQFSPDTSGGLMPSPAGNYGVDPTLFGNIDPQLLAYQAQEIERQNLAAANAQAAGGPPHGVESRHELSVKLANLPVVRLPVQRRATQGLNMNRRCNVEAALAYISGQQPTKSCSCCAKTFGPWNDCVVYEGQMLGACSNCWFNASGSRCTFQGDKHPKPEPDQEGQESQQGSPSPSAAAQSSSPQPPVAQAAAAPGTQPTSGSRRNSPSGAAASPSRSARNRTSTPASRRGSPGRAAATASSRSPSASVGGIDPPANVTDHDMAHWRLADSTRRALERGLNDPARMSDPAAGASIRRRLVARIESAAEELGVRMAEFDEFSRSPAGMAAERVHREARREAAATRRDAREGGNNGGGGGDENNNNNNNN